VSLPLIPVMDLLAGQVVRAVRGDRTTYQPIRSRLCAGAEPLTVARALLSHTASGILYVADLDALQGGAPQQATWQALLSEVPGLTLWLDAGFVDADHARQLLGRLGDAAQRITPVFGSESLRDAAALLSLRTWAEGESSPAPVLSLDRRHGQRLDQAACWTTPQAWPQRVIVMTLERVGAGVGPDLQTLAELQALSPSTQLIGAGGVRDVADLEAAERAGARAWLVASALHDGGIPPSVQAPPRCVTVAGGTP
jgi:uncharacterized protein related to proFAR isomerase